jgi:hypothetical protein
MSTDLAPRLSLAVVPSPTRPRPPLTAEQRADVDVFYRVDRSHFAHYPLPRWSPEGQKGDAWVTQQHAATTIGERIEAWRILFEKHTTTR